MAWVSRKSCTFNGRQVKAGDPLPECDSWDQARLEARERAGRIAFVSSPPAPAQVENGAPTPGPVMEPGALASPSPLVEEPAPAQAPEHKKKAHKGSKR